MAVGTGRLAATAPASQSLTRGGNTLVPVHFRFGGSNVKQQVGDRSLHSVLVSSELDPRFRQLVYF